MSVCILENIFTVKVLVVGDTHSGTYKQDQLAIYCLSFIMHGAHSIYLVRLVHSRFLIVDGA
jgi:hypothetical protein